MEDYLGQQMRLAGLFRGLAHEVAVSAAETASENIDRMQQETREAVDRAGEQVSQTARDANSFVQETQYQEAARARAGPVDLRRATSAAS